MKRILTIDGGGIRGIIPCSALAALEEQTGRLTRELFDYVAGTSTGALLASAIAIGLPARQMLSVYTDRTSEIFTPAQPWAKAKMIATGSSYDPAAIYKVVKQVFGARASWRLNDCPIGIMIAADGVNHHRWFFVKDNPKNAGTTGKFSLLDCATASAAAPTYFKPWNIEPIGWLYDGGVGAAANPVYEACVEAFYYDDFSPAETSVVSLGTGYYPGGDDPPGNLLAIVEWTIDAILDAAGDQQTEIVDRHWPGLLQRFDWQLPEPIDMAATGKIPELVAVGAKAAASLDWKKILKL